MLSISFGVLIFTMAGMLDGRLPDCKSWDMSPNTPQFVFPDPAKANAAFARVMEGCAARREGTWIHPEMIQAYQALFDAGYAQSIEVWQGNDLVGGVYGVRVGRVFFAESMFSLVTDASKIALAHLVSHDWLMIDCQFYTSHLASLGARQISRASFLQLLAKGVGDH